MKLLKLAALLGCMTVAGSAATITVTQGFGAQGILVTSDGATAVPSFVWAVGNYTGDVWTQFGAAVPDTDKINGAVTAMEPASLNSQVIHLWVGMGAAGSDADFTTPWVILRHNTSTAFPPDVALSGSTTLNASNGANMVVVASSDPGNVIDGNFLTIVPEPSAALLGLIGLLGFIRRRR